MKKSDIKYCTEKIKDYFELKTMYPNVKHIANNMIKYYDKRSEVQ